MKLNTFLHIYCEVSKYFVPFFIGFLLAFPLLICRSSDFIYRYMHTHILHIKQTSSPSLLVHFYSLSGGFLTEILNFKIIIHVRYLLNFSFSFSCACFKIFAFLKAMKSLILCFILKLYSFISFIFHY